MLDSIAVGICLYVAVVLISYLHTQYLINKRCKPNKDACDYCGCEALSLLRSLNVKKCTTCGYEKKWNLDPGQMPLVRSNRMVKRNED
jgi:hypothetical protein